MPDPAPRTEAERARSRRIVIYIVAAPVITAVVALALRDTVGVGAMSHVPPVSFRAFASAPPLPGAEELIPCDLDGDGKGDFILKNQPRPTVYFGRGDGTFDAVNFPFGGPTEIPLVPADLDGDKTTDFLLTDQATRVLLLRGFDFVWPTGEFKVDPNAAPAAKVPPDGGGRVLQKQEGVFSSVSYRDADGLVGPGVGAHVLAGDLDGNHLVDLIVQPTRDLPEPTEDPEVTLGGNIPWPRFYDPARGYFADAKAAAAAPLATPEANSFLELRFNILGEQMGLLKAARSSALHGAYTNLIAGDFNGDKRLDFVRQPKGAFAEKSAPALLYLADTNGFRVERLHALNGTASRVDSTMSGDEVRLSTGDFNGDGKTDLLWKRERGFAEGKARVQLWISAGDGGFGVVEPTGTEPLWFAETTRLYASDIDGDGKADLLVQDTRQPAASFPVQQIAAPAAAPAK